MSNELTDVRCPCGAEFQADSYDAGFIAGSGMCQNCDAALPPKDICTCPSGDGSLRHPCPAHPASVELAGAAANLTFINGRPAMCGCQVEYSSGGGEYSDVIYVTLCAKHSGSAILDLVATNRIALTPEYEGQWHADLYLDREIPLAKAEGATPAEAVLALMSEERIDPEQGGVDQAGGDRWDALQSIMEWTAAENIPDDRKLCLIRNAARAALAQPSGEVVVTKNESGAIVSVTRQDKEGRLLSVIAESQPSPAQAEKAEAERPIVSFEKYMQVMYDRDENAKRLDAALARVAELEGQSGIEFVYDSDELVAVPRGLLGAACHAIDKKRDAPRTIAKLREYARGLPAPVAQAQHSVPEASEQEKEQGWNLDYRFVERVTDLAASRTEYTTSMEATEQVLLAARELLASAPGKEGV
ncbi:hypothetical protein RY185_17010 [Pseudomonas aeruginosa]|uniref:hypothetical protein n=1 Tax=Pseudomonas aeruginosa TaxID=287 RepID=UPI0029333EF2|nr:hypothetical protein [Pseudomonas aeruginosa]MDV2243522.1 hypothetical protein [Pseudomonas aeruginosa]